jgi:hypothetical protein
MDDRRHMEDRRKATATNGQGSFFILKLLALIRRYRMEHIKASSQTRCNCIICVEAEKLLDEGSPNNPNRWG